MKKSVSMKGERSKEKKEKREKANILAEREERKKVGKR